MFWRSIGFKLITLIVAFSLVCTGAFVYLSGITVRNVTFALAFVLGLSATGSLFVYKIIFRPLRDIIHGVKEISAGNLDTRIDVGGQRDEIGYLAESFNRMAARIRAMAANLSGMNQELERKVEERTQELKKTQMSVLQSEKLASLGLMAAAIAHEINNPLTAVLTYSSLLLRDAPEGSELREDLEVVVGETTRCREIVRGLLDFARGSEMHQKTMNVNGLLEKTISLVAGQATFHDIRILRDLAKYMPDMVMDDGQIKQLFINIMLNAADAMPNGGSLKVRTTFDYELNEVTVEFRDSGVGIPEPDLIRIFDPFFTTKEKGKGTGLGLSVAYGIVQRHSGAISVKSAPGKGTAFIITFPVA